MLLAVAMKVGYLTYTHVLLLPRVNAVVLISKSLSFNRDGLFRCVGLGR
jgi:hypothetical protein